MLRESFPRIARVARLWKIPSTLSVLSIRRQQDCFKLKIQSGLYSVEEITENNPEVAPKQLRKRRAYREVQDPCLHEMKAPSTSSQHAVLWQELWNGSRTASAARRLLQEATERDELYFTDYVPPARDAIAVPKYIIYIILGVVVVVVGMYGITGHLIKDLFHDLADWLLGANPEEEAVEEELQESTGVQDRQGERRVRWGRRSTEMAEEKRTILPGFPLSLTT
ncbi:uncharacterized protein LOC108439666 [Pygocentrus nattereri]|uniref:uncharacterized protein LOC108439666 n=1 Tax=Pygocentrus nattereri TaxID=42514 RepID=UPI0008142036|nr:uncharacterized protein LOC108439666 [Pygocentrus nattereri]